MNNQLNYVTYVYPQRFFQGSWIDEQCQEHSYLQDFHLKTTVYEALVHLFSSESMTLIDSIDYTLSDSCGTYESSFTSDGITVYFTYTRDGPTLEIEYTTPEVTTKTQYGMFNLNHLNDEPMGADLANGLEEIDYDVVSDCYNSYDPYDPISLPTSLDGLKFTDNAGIKPIVYFLKPVTGEFMKETKYTDYFDSFVAGSP